MAQKNAISLLNLSIIIQSVKILPWGKFVQEGGLKEGVYALDYLGGFVFQKESFFKSGTDHINKSIIESPRLSHSTWLLKKRNTQLVWV